MLAEFIRKILV